MTDLRSALGKYLSMRKGLGYKYEHQTRRLPHFVTFMEKRKASDEARPGMGDTAGRSSCILAGAAERGTRLRALPHQL